MKKFKYVAVNPKDDQVTRKDTTANSRQEVESLLKSQDLDVVMIEEIKAQGSFSNIKFGQKITRQDKIALTNELAIMLKAGISIVDSLNIIKEGHKNKYLIEIIESIKYSVQTGNSLSTAFKAYPKDFDPIFISMIEAGENSGKLAKTLTELSSEIKRDDRLVKDVTGAMIYPAIILATLIVIGFSMFIFVVPKIAQVYESLEVPIPLSTKIFLAIGLFLSTKWWLALPILFILAILLIWGLRSKQGRKVLGVIQSKTPVLNNIFHLFNYVRFTRVLSILLDSGVQINQSVIVASKGFSDPKLAQSAREMSKDLEEGVSLAESMRKKEEFPITMIKMIEVGEKSGKLDSILSQLSEYYAHDLNDKLSRFASIIEPVLMVAIGIAIGAMVISLIGPIYGIIGQLQI